MTSWKAARMLAVSERKSRGTVISELARRALRPTQIREAKGFPTFDVPTDAPAISLEMVYLARDEA